MEDRLRKQMEFIIEVDKLKKIKRQTYLSDGINKENDAEHSWHIALMTVLLSEYSNEEIDVLRVVKMLLIHDIVEIDAGDTYAYDAKGNETKREREVLAANRIFGILPEEQKDEYIDLWEEFEQRQTSESKFAHVMDNLQPMMLNNKTDGKAWREHEVDKSQIYKRNEITGKGSTVLWEYAKEMIEENVKKGNVTDRSKEN
jgi:putative hydrolase of HD superfamily